MADDPLPGRVSNRLRDELEAPPLRAPLASQARFASMPPPRPRPALRGVAAGFALGAAFVIVLGAASTGSPRPAVWLSRAVTSAERITEALTPPAEPIRGTPSPPEVSPSGGGGQAPVLPFVVTTPAARPGQSSPEPQPSPSESPEVEHESSTAPSPSGSPRPSPSPSPTADEDLAGLVEHASPSLSPSPSPLPSPSPSDH
ncbi:MAG: hypothetical protein NVS9B1_11100 [Candidatus Dormibacteraceae bacterium]